VVIFWLQRRTWLSQKKVVFRLGNRAKNSSGADIMKLGRLADGEYYKGPSKELRDRRNCKYCFLLISRATGQELIGEVGASVSSFFRAFRGKMFMEIVRNFPEFNKTSHV
jgi:hypothetical protein